MSRRRTGRRIVAAGIVLAIGGCGADEGPPPPSGPPCAAGFTRLASGGCAPVLPASCDQASIALPGDVECRRIGVTTCAAGFSSDGSGGCEPQLPATACAAGMMAVPGESSCREVSDCGTGPWGGVAIESSASYVDRSFAGSGSDGSAAKPFTTVAAAIAGADATKNPMIVVAAGVYEENLVVDKKVRLFGRCARMVEIRGIASRPSLLLDGDVEVHGVAITGAGVGVQVARGTARLSRVWIHDTEDAGIWAEKPVTISLEGSLVEAARFMGIGVYGSAATIEASVVRGTRARVDGNFGYGLYGGPVAKQGSVLTVHGSVISKNVAAGVVAYSSQATIDASVVADTQARVADRQLGLGVLADIDKTTKLPSELVVTGSVVANNRDEGILVQGSKATIRSSVVRDTQPMASDKTFGHGLETGAGSELRIESSLFTGNRTGSIVISGTKGSILSTIVRDTLPTAGSRARDTAGNGLYVAADTSASAISELLVQDTLITGSHSAGMNIIGSKVTIESSIVEATLPRALDGAFGRGIEAAADGPTKLATELVLRRSIVRDNHDVGVFVFGSHATVESSVIQATRARALDGKHGDGLVVSIGVAGEAAFPDASLSVVDSVVDGNPRAGLASFGARLSVTRSSVTCSAVDIDVESVEALDEQKAPRTQDGGGNVCGCGAAAACIAQSTGLEPITPNR